jgi:hypothetical protein
MFFFMSLQTKKLDMAKWIQTQTWSRSGWWSFAKRYDFPLQIHHANHDAFESWAMSRILPRISLQLGRTAQARFCGGHMREQSAWSYCSVYTCEHRHASERNCLSWCLMRAKLCSSLTPTELESALSYWHALSSVVQYGYFARYGLLTIACWAGLRLWTPLHRSPTKEHQ